MNTSTFAFEFKNGVYLSNDVTETTDTTNKVEEKKVRKPFKELAKNIAPKFVEKDSVEYASLDLSKITNKFLNIEFDNKEYAHWSEIETPFLDKIFKHQQVPEEDMKWAFIQLGRLLYPFQLHDEWYLVVFLHGVPHSGKSELFDLMCDIIGSQHIHPEEAGPSVKLVALDASKTFDLDKDKINKSIRSIIPWKSSMIMQGSSNPFDPDAHTTEHLFSFNFKHPYEGEDIGLKKKLRGEIGNIVRKLNEAYLESLLEYGEHGGDVKYEFPEFFLP